MHTNVLERVRALEADIERCIDSVVQQDLFAANITNERHRILLDHFTLQQAAIVKTTAEKLLDAYLDEDDIEAVQNAPADTADDITAAVKEFEAKIADIREYHHNYRDLPSVRHDLATPDPKLLAEVFSLNERFGACLDVDAHYARYSAFMVHTKTIAESCDGEGSSALLAELAPLAPSSVRQWSPMWAGRLDFFRFPKALPDILLSETEAHRKVVAFGLYKAFVENVVAYLVDFYHRVHPLKTSTLNRLLEEVESDGEEYWAALLAAKAEVKSVAATAAAAEVDGEELTAAVEDEEGTLADQETQRRPKSTARVAVENKVSCGIAIPPSLRRHAKKFSLWPITMIENVIRESENAEEKTDEDAQEASSRKTSYPTSLAEVKKVCFAEAKSAALLHSLLFSVLENTDRTLLRDYSRTMEELEGDRAEAEAEFLASLAEVKRNSASTMEGSVAHAAQYNHLLRSRDGKPNSMVGGANGRYGRGRGGPAAAAPAPAPVKVVVEEEQEKEELLGENGEPIPRWLAQLHQLDKVFKCDVCGGTVYKGPKVFREHFGGERHAEGLRRLGVTQRLRSFEGITSIREVVELRDKLSAAESGFRKRLRENMDHEEIQDGRGRVLSGKAYERRQNSRR